MNYGKHKLQTCARGGNKETWYIRDASGSLMGIYEKEGEAALAQTELPIYGASKMGTFYKKAGNSVYELSDHLGNIRAVIGEKTTTEELTMETDQATEEEANFVNVSAARQIDVLYAHSGTASARLNAAEGSPGKSLKVNAGSTVTMEVFAKYGPVSSNTNLSQLAAGLFASALSGNLAATAGPSIPAKIN